MYNCIVLYLRTILPADTPLKILLAKSTSKRSDPLPPHIHTHLTPHGLLIFNWMHNKHCKNYTVSVIATMLDSIGIKGFTDQMRELHLACSRVLKKKFIPRKVTCLTYMLHAAGANDPVDFSLFIWKTYASHATHASGLKGSFRRLSFCMECRSTPEWASWHNMQCTQCRCKFYLYGVCVWGGGGGNSSDDKM